MDWNSSLDKIEWLENFTPKNSSDITFDMYKNFADSEESLRRYWDAFSDFYYISCLVLPDELDSLEDEWWEDIMNWGEDNELGTDESDSKFDEEKLQLLEKLFPDESLEDIMDLIEDYDIDWKKYDEEKLKSLKELFPDKSLEGILDFIENDGIDWKKVREEQKKQWENAISKFQKYPGLYNLLQRCSCHMQNGHPLEILIGKYSEESMAKARRFTEERRKEFEWMWFTVWNPREYVYILGFFGGSTWRANQEIIRDIRDMFPDKVKEIKLGVVKNDNKKEDN